MASEDSQAATAALVAALDAPASVSGDAGSVSNRPLAELIEADRYVAGKDAGAKARRGLRITRLLPPGSV